MTKKEEIQPQITAELKTAEVCPTFWVSRYRVIKCTTPQNGPHTECPSCMVKKHSKEDIACALGRQTFSGFLKVRRKDTAVSVSAQINLLIVLRTIALVRVPLTNQYTYMWVIKPVYQLYTG